MAWLINPTQLDKFRKNQKSIMILDASWHLPTAERDAKQEYLNKHIADAHFLDLNLFHDTNSTIPNTLLSDEDLISERLSNLGIRDDFKIVLYDNSSLHTACRALWMFKVFGHNTNQLYILNGGLTAWERHKGKIESGEKLTSARSYKAKLQPQHLCSLEQMKQNVRRPTQQVIDLRHAVRYSGGAEIRPDLRRGHIPGSFSFPYTTMFDKDGYFLALDKIRRQLADIGVEINAPIITTCGSGMTAPILNVVLELLNHPAHSLYDGSWSEWGASTLYAGETNLNERPIITSLDS